MNPKCLPKINLDRWRPHVLAALQSGQSLAAYARAHQLSKHTLYLARMHLRAAGELPSAMQRVVRQPRPHTATTAAFVPVTRASSSACCAFSVQLPNGVRLQFEARDGEMLGPLLQQLAALPCST